MRMSIWIHRIVVVTVLSTVMGCGASKPDVDPAKLVEPEPEPPPECLPGCETSDEGLCQTHGSYLDNTTVNQVAIDCDVRCCEPGMQTVNAKDPDGDGIAGDADQCPNEAEDFDGFQDEDGCPEPDNDGDGILDADDVCPLDAETPNGFQDDDGCAD